MNHPNRLATRRSHPWGGRRTRQASSVPLPFLYGPWYSEIVIRRSKGAFAVEKGLLGLIFLKPDRLTLRIIDLDKHQVVNEARSGSLHVGQQAIANYAENISAIANNLLGFKRLLADYQVTNYYLYGALTDIDLVTGKYVANQIYVRTGLKIKWLNKDQTLANVLAAVDKVVEHEEIEKKQLTGYVLNIGLNTSNLAYYKKASILVLGKSIWGKRALVNWLIIYGKQLPHLVTLF